MKVQSLFVVLFLFCLLLPSWQAEAVETVTQTPQATAAAAPDETAELQLLYEEKDLVTATKRSTPLRKAPAVATVITADEIRDMGARNLLDVLKMVPGVGISMNEYGVNMIEVRGIRTTFNEKILIMIDGHSINKNSFGSGLHLLADTLPVENIKQVEVVRGPGSALYGSSAFMATINIITRDAEEIDGLETKISGGSFDTFKGNLVGAAVHGDKLAASGSIDYYRSSGPNLRVASDVLRSTPFSAAPGAPHLDVKQTDAFLKVVYGDFSFRGHYLTSRKGYYIGFGFAVTDRTNHYCDIENYWGELAWNRRISENLDATIKLYYDHYSQDPLVKSLPNGFNNSFPEGRIGEPIMQNGTIGTEWQIAWEPFKGNRLSTGLVYEDFQQYGVKRLANFNPLTGAYVGPLQEVANWNREVGRQNASFYLQDEWQLSKSINLTVGARYDHYSDFGDAISPRAGLVWTVLENADLKLLYGRAFRAPNFQELYNINTVSNAGNPNLKPERIETLEAGVAYRISRTLQLELNYFHSDIDDLITRDGSVTPTSFINAGRADIQGVEAGLQGRAFDSIRWKTTYAWQDPRDGVTGQRLPYVPSHRATASLNYGLSRYLNLHGDIQWTGARPRAQGDIRSEMPSYTTVDIALTAHGLYKGLEFQLVGHNLFNKHYHDPDTSGGANKIPDDFPREGISVLVNIVYKF
ncbi:MAG: TonB-dependent receptor [Nitrospirae bacterium]|nr:TonB-dependent receptor [Nitrospirota bacterium]